MISAAFSGAVAAAGRAPEPIFADALYSFDANQAGGQTGTLLLALNNVGSIPASDFISDMPMITSPSVELVAFAGGHKSINFDGANDRMELQDSLTTMDFVNRTGMFHFYFVMRFDAFTFPFSYPFANAETGTEVGFAMYTAASRKLGFIMFKGNGTNHVGIEMPENIQIGRTYLIDISGDGTTCYIKIDNGAQQTAAFGNLPFNAGANPFSKTNIGQLLSDVAQDVGVSRVLVYTSKRSAGVNTQIRAAMAARYGMAV